MAVLSSADVHGHGGISPASSLVALKKEKVTEYLYPGGKPFVAPEESVGVFKDQTLSLV